MEPRTWISQEESSPKKPCARGVQETTRKECPGLGPLERGSKLSQFWKGVVTLVPGRKGQLNKAMDTVDASSKPA